ncbi:MAG: hypothetical protein IPP87_18820 [Ideonella sp.]|nr:hypothetical protein [Ideonella sp.]MBL0150624.1 hypothetical protein [Ideonella sp.]
MSSSNALVVASRAAVPRPALRRARPWRTAFLVLSVLTLLGLFWLYQQLAPAFGSLSGAPLSVVIDGDEVFNGLSLPSFSPLEQLVAVAGVLLAALLVAVIVPTVLLFTLLTVGVVLLCALGVPLLLASAGVLLLLSPLILMGLLAWWLLKALLS